MTDIIKKDNLEENKEPKNEPTIADLLESSKKESQEEISSLKAKLEALEKSLNESKKETDVNTSVKKETVSKEDDFKAFVQLEIQKAKKEGFIESLSKEQTDLLKKIPSSESLTVAQIKAMLTFMGQKTETVDNSDNSTKKKSGFGVDIKENKPKQGEEATPENILKAAFPERYKDKSK